MIGLVKSFLMMYSNIGLNSCETVPLTQVCNLCTVEGFQTSHGYLPFQKCMLPTYPPLHLFNVSKSVPFSICSTQDQFNPGLSCNSFDHELVLEIPIENSSFASNFECRPPTCKLCNLPKPWPWVAIGQFGRVASYLYCFPILQYGSFFLK